MLRPLGFHLRENDAVERLVEMMAFTRKRACNVRLWIREGLTSRSILYFETSWHVPCGGFETNIDILWIRGEHGVDHFERLHLPSEPARGDNSGAEGSYENGARALCEREERTPSSKRQRRELEALTFDSPGEKQGKAVCEREERAP